MRRILTNPPAHSAGLLLAAFAIATLAASSATADITNRYSFTTDASDSVGEFDGALQGTAAVGGGMLTLAGGAAGASYVDLGAGLASAASSGGNSGEISVEYWGTLNTTGDWRVIFSFGNSGPDAMDNNGGDGDYWQLIPQSGGTGPFRSTTHYYDESVDPPVGAEVGVDSPTLAIETPYHIVNVLNVANNTNQVYVNGALVASGGIQAGFDPNTYATVGDTQNWLGRSQWGDESLNGTYDEFRVYDTALTPKQVLVNNYAGPDTLNPDGDLLSLKVDPNTGQVQLINNVGGEIDFDYYEITSAGGALNASTWNSLADQDGLPSPTQGWDESGGSDDNQLLEFYLGDPDGDLSDAFAANSMRSLGAAFDPSVFGAGNDGDLVFNFGVAGSDALINGGVVYGPIGGGGDDADVNGDGQVDGADFLQAQRSPGFAAFLSDFQTQYGNGVTAVAASSAVPEPATGLGLLVLAACGLAARRKREI